MATIQGFIAEVVDEIEALSGIKYSPDEPSEQITAWPASFTYAASGRSGTMQTPSQYVVLHDVQIAILVPDNDFRQMFKTMLPYCELVYNALTSMNNDRTSSHADTFGAISYALGPVDWGGFATFGYIFTIEGVKIVNTVT